MARFDFAPRSMAQLRAQAVDNGLMDAARAMAEGPQPRPVNVRQVLDLGALTYFQWRGRSYGVPPLPWKAGADLLDAYLGTLELGPTVTRESLPAYRAGLKRMANIAWRNTRPDYGPRLLYRVLHALHLLPNPFRRASEADLVEIAVFYLGRRTRGRESDPFQMVPRSLTT